jgi:hypothetical protein
VRRSESKTRDPRRIDAKIIQRREIIAVIITALADGS